MSASSGAIPTGLIQRLAVASLVASITPAAPALAQLVEGDVPPIVTTLTLFAGTPEGLWQSSSWGREWERAMGDASGESLEEIGEVYSIVVLTTSVYVGAASGLYYSRNFGQKWEKREVDAEPLVVLPSRYPRADATIFIGTRDGLIKSKDAGRTFDPTPIADTPVHRIEWPGPALVVGTGNGVEFSTDAAESFEPAGEGLPPGSVSALALSSFFAMDPVLFVGVGDAGVVRSSDGGRSWVRAGLGGKHIFDLIWLGPFLYAATDAGLFRTQDLGKSWVELGKGLEQRQIRRILFPLAPDSGAELFVATDDGVYRSLDGGMRFFAAGLEGHSVNLVATFPPPQPFQEIPRK